MPEMEFHISRAARDRYEFDEKLFSLTGNVVFANFHAARTFAQKMNAKRDVVNFPEQAVKAGQINAMGLIDEILHYVVQLYREQENSVVMQDALEFLYAELGEKDVNDALKQFVDEFPTVAVYRNAVSPDEYLEGETDGTPNRAIALEEMLLLWLANANPAFSPFNELFDDDRLERTAYSQIVTKLHGFFDAQPRFGPENQNLVDMLRDPAEKVPHSLSGQLEYIRERWSSLLGKYLYRLLSSLDLIAEEEKATFGPGGPGPAYVPEFAHLEHEPERFTPDKDWMPKVVLLAKNAYVWLDQLSKKYGQDLSRLDQVPDQELDHLAEWGFTGLWLIGIWERSEASKRIKHLCGNPDAVASAYSLKNYDVSHKLGGPEAYRDLKDRAWQRGIRMGGDMVPNHMGIDSEWVTNHPDWFVQLDYSPFPSYSFNGPDLSDDDRVGIFIEDHYYDRTDAAVVFKRVDYHTGDTKFIYHGNDGTSMPWNDTAQLNFLKEEVREAVVQTILHVARQFPIIRFDAAMTLAKKHYQRLWFPQPGTGGAIPSRAEHGLTKEQFNEVFPKEFWREVVDRVQEEEPETLLLAEAFWLMEGYFVRTLGMHRVYNSAFMNMLKDEENSKYRDVIKNTIEFDPEILKRYVNFMNNPDEDTAVSQFGKDDKYFGVCTMMATMPGLPMFGHGQIEGFTEKYGMEYQRAYWDETPDQYLIDRHKREIFPLLRKRYLFAEVDNFLLYDFYAPEGHVNEDVFAYSNRAGGERALVVYHNKWAEARGWIKAAAAYLDKSTGNLVQKNLGEGLGLHNDSNYYTIFRDHVTGLEYIRSSKQLHEQGLYVELGAFKYRVYMDFREVADNEWNQYGHLTSYLDGRGVPSIDQAMKEVFLQPVHRPFRELVSAGTVRQVMTAALDAGVEEDLLDDIETTIVDVLTEINDFIQANGDAATVAGTIRPRIDAALHLPALEDRLGDEEAVAEALAYLEADLDETPTVWGTLHGWLVVHRLGAIVDALDVAQLSRSWIDELLLGKLIAAGLRDLGLSEDDAWRQVRLIKLLTSHQAWYRQELQTPAPATEDAETKASSPEQSRAYLVLRHWLNDEELQGYLGVNRYQSVLYYNRESFERLLWWMMVVAAVDISAGAESDDELAEALAETYEVIAALQDAEDRSDYQVEKLLEAAQ